MGPPDAWPGAEAPCERVGMLEQVVHALDARVLERHPAAMRAGHLGGRVQHRVDRVAIVERDERATQLVVGRVERDGQRDRQRLAARRIIPGTTPTVLTVMWRAEIPRSPWMRSIAAQTES